MKVNRRLSALLTAVLCLALLAPASVCAEESLEDVPQVLNYGGSEYQFIGDNVHQKTYSNGTAYILAVKSGGGYYALGENLDTVALTLKNGALSAESGVAEIVSEGEGTLNNFNNEHPARIGSKYLTIKELNGPLALSGEKAFLWNFNDRTYDDPQAMFYGKISGNDASVSGCVTFQDGKFGSTQWGSMTEDNLYIYQKLCAHANAKEYPAKAASCLEGGMDACFQCPDCGSWLNVEKEYLSDINGSVSQYSSLSFEKNALGHHYVNGVCTRDPSHIALDYEPVTAGMDLFEEGYLYIIAAPESTAAGAGSTWKVMDYDPEHPSDHSVGCTAVMGSDGKLRIDNTNDETRSAAEFRITNAAEDEEIKSDLRRVPVGSTYDDDLPWGMWAPDNGAKICWMKTDSGYALLDKNWGYAEHTHHPHAILVRDDGIAEIQILTYTQLMPHYSYGTATVYQDFSGTNEKVTCFHWDDNEENAAPAPANVRLFRAKVPACAVNAQIQHGAAAYSIVSDREQEVVLSIISYDDSGRMTDCVCESVTLKEGANQSVENLSVADAAEYGVFLLEKDSLRPLSVKRYPQGQ